MKLSLLFLYYRICFICCCDTSRHFWDSQCRC